MKKKLSRLFFHPPFLPFIPLRPYLFSSACRAALSAAFRCLRLAELEPGTWPLRSNVPPGVPAGLPPSSSERDSSVGRSFSCYCYIKLSFLGIVMNMNAVFKILYLNYYIFIYTALVLRKYI